MKNTINKTSPPSTFAGLAAIALTIASPQAAITVIHQDFGEVIDSGAANQVLETSAHTFSYDAGAAADKLVVTLTSETGGGSSSDITITYNGVALSNVPGTVSNRSKGIWYLDNPSTAGAADLVFNLTNFGTVNGIGFGVVSISGSAPGFDVANSNAGFSTSLNPTVANSFVVSNYGSNSGQVPVVPSGHTEIYADGDVGSTDGASAYLNGVAAAPLTITYAQGGTVAGNSTSAAAFSPIPEPSSTALFGLGGIALVFRRRR